MVRLVGAVLVAVCCSWLGFCAAEELHKRTQALRQMAAGLVLLERELELGGPPLEQLLTRGADRSQGPARALFRGCARGLERLDEEEFSSLWRRQLSQRKELGEEGQSLLLPLGNLLGRYDAEQQRDSIAAVRIQLEELAARSDTERRRQGRVYQVLGLSGGAFLVILLL